MTSPFPGMDPYLEHPEIWPGVHLFLIAALSDFLSPQLRPKYSVSVEVRMYESLDEQSLLVGIPDVVVQKNKRKEQTQPITVAVAEPKNQPTTVRVPMPVSVRQGFLEVREVATKAVVTAIEILSPVNKRSGPGRQTYKTKRQRVLGSETHLVEIDLLRAHEPMPVYAKNIDSDYRILVSRSESRPQAQLYHFNVTDGMPTFQLPLKDNDQAPTVNLKALLDDIYDRSGYDLKLDYCSSPVPAFSSETTAWLDSLLKTKGLR
ncbi:MAG: DUF4058 family protein [Cyanobacteria bacterium J06573_11]